MSSHLAGLDVAVLIAYVVGVVAFGSYFVRRSRSTEGFMAAGRRIPGWAVGLSILGTYVSSISFLALPGKAYSANWNAFVFSLSLPLAAWVATRYFVPLYRKRGEISAYSYLEDRFGPWARSYATICYLLTQVVRMGAIMCLVAMPLHRLLGWDVGTIIIATGVLVTIYTLLGGIEAVIWTDVVQSIVLIGGAVASAALLLFGLPEGMGQLFAIGAEHHKFSLGSFGPSLTEATFWVVLLYGLFINLQNFGIDQSYIQRYVTARSTEDARKSVWLGALLYIPISALFFFIGTGLFAYYTAHPQLLSPDIIAAGKPDWVFPHFIVTELPMGVRGVLIAAIFAAAMSSVDSSLNCSATLILTDFYKRYFRRDAGERESMRVLYISTLVWGILGTCIGLAISQVPEGVNILDVWWNLAGIFSGGMLGLFLLGYFSRRARSAPAAIAACIGILVIVWMTLPKFPGLKEHLGAFANPLNSLLICVIGTLTIFLVGLALSALVGNAKGKTQRDE